MLGCFCKQKEVKKWLILLIKNETWKDVSKELAKELGTEQANISRWENNPLSMNSKNLIKVALYFNVSIDDLLGVDKSA